MRRCVIFAGGEIADASFIDTAEIKDCFVICADSGYEYAKRSGILPDLIVGDFDSYVGQLPEGVEIHRSVPEKDDTDTMLSIKEAIARGCTRISLYGGLGARFDHTFANIQGLIYAHEHGCKMEIVDMDNEITVQGAGEVRYERRDNQYFSIFALTETAEISLLRGVKYPLTNCIMRQSFPLGVSNEITEDSALLRIGYGLVLVVRANTLP